MFSTLYIVGNGLDLYHKLDTKYSSFGTFLKNKDAQIYDLLTQYFTNDEDGIWGNFEECLAELDFKALLDDYAYLVPDISSSDFRDRDWHSYQIEMKLIVENLTVNLCKLFKEFILEVKFLEQINDKKLCFEKDSAYLSFNYTDTLEKYYDIDKKNILYIHGKAKNTGDRLILGHGRNPSNLKKSNEREESIPPEGLSEEQMEMWIEEMSDKYSYSYESAHDELTSYFDASHKPTSEIILINKEFFNSLKNLKKIIVLGSSLSEVDKDYFKEILEVEENKKIPWIISYYEDSDQKSHLQKLTSWGLSEKHINFIEISALTKEN